ncbi:hypothetical protein BLNAU_7820 [Blattamonas nauphoetae]|uniref:Uncharacterized protein n=1 Tax=Blattamonas nauphoetae TaxID=2049346 RepID=A0ABQ9Y0F3_9EUKA|nr:hypothetical protein BLNAU_7820 [Blattamonas nauphoetae]
MNSSKHSTSHKTQVDSHQCTCGRSKEECECAQTTHCPQENAHKQHPVPSMREPKTPEGQCSCGKPACECEASKTTHAMNPIEMGNKTPIAGTVAAPSGWNTRVH